MGIQKTGLNSGMKDNEQFLLNSEANDDITYNLEK